MNDFTILYNQLVASIQNISTNVNSLQRMVSKVGTAEDESHLRVHIRSLEQQTNALAKQSNTDIHLLSRISQTTIADQTKERRLLCEKLRTDFLDVLNKLQETQRNAKYMIKTHPLQRKSVSNNPFYANEDFNFESTTLSFKDETLAETQAQITDQEEDERYRLKLAEEQNAAVKELESNIVDVNQIFQELAKMVYEQQEVIDNIETNMETVNVRVESGNQQLRSAAEYQRKARKKRLMIVVIFAIILVILTLIIYFSVNH